MGLSDECSPIEISFNCRPWGTRLSSQQLLQNSTMWPDEANVQNFTMRLKEVHVPMNTDYNAQLLRAFRRRQLDCFRKTLSLGADPDTRCTRRGITLLCLACKDCCREEYVKALLNAGADPNLDSPVMVAAREENYEALEMLLQQPGLDVNIPQDCGGSILHFLCGAPCKLRNSERMLHCLSLVIDRPDVQINKPDAFGMTPIMCAAEMYHEDRVQLMLRQKKHKINIDILQPSLGNSVREFIIKRFFDLKMYLPPRVIEDINSKDPNTRLIAALQHRNLDVFNSILKETDKDGRPLVDPDYWHDDPYYCTCLELACRNNGCEEFVKALLEAGADPTSVSKNDGTPLIHFVLDCCNLETLKVLLEDGRIDISKSNNMNLTALHVAAVQRCENPEDNERSCKCVEMLLNVKKKSLINGCNQSCIDINCQDGDGNTALHYAAQYGCAEVVLTLLRRGANLMVKNNKQIPPLHYIGGPILEKFLDEQLDSNNYSSRNGSYTIVFKYGFLQAPHSREYSSEMEPLQWMAEPHLRHLLQHPVISSYLYLKWSRVRGLFYFEILCYTIFVIALTAYILLNRTDLSHTCDSGLERYLERDIDSNFTNRVPQTPFSGFQRILENDRYHAMKVWFVVVLFFMGFIISEIFQIYMLRLQYFKNPANYMNALVTTTTGIIISNHWIDDCVYKHLCAISVLIAWVDLILISGRLPTYSIHLEMLKKVTKTFLKFMVWYFLLIIAFALSFHALFFKFKREEEEGGEHNIFMDPLQSLVKTIVMFTGEFSFSNLYFSAVPGTSHVVFVIFVFLISIVLLNLLNGLAVYDTQAIKENARVLSLVSLVHLVSGMERTLMDIFTSSLRAGTIFVQYFPDPRLYPNNNCSLRRQIQVFPNEKGKIKFYLDTDNTNRFKKFRMDETVIKFATSIITRRQQCSDMDQIKEMFQKLSQKLEELEKNNENIDKLLDNISKQHEQPEKILDNISDVEV